MSVYVCVCTRTVESGEQHKPLRKRGESAASDGRSGGCRGERRERKKRRSFLPALARKVTEEASL